MKAVADGETDKGRDGEYFSARARKLAPRGMVLVEWEPDHERGEKEATLMWLLLQPPPRAQVRSLVRGGKWKLEWRLAPRMAVPSRRARQAPGAAGSARVA